MMEGDVTIINGPGSSHVSITEDRSLSMRIIKITIAICTWNRSSLLSKTLEQMRRLIIPPGIDWEILVINNKCTDNTDEIVRNFLGKLPIRLLHESTSGLSNARNKAIREAKGDYILWTDDDVLVHENWLSAYAEAFAKYPDAAVFGGPVEPWFEGTPPDWLLENWDRFSHAYAIKDLGKTPIALQVMDNRIPYGANYAVRMIEQADFLYDPLLGLNQNKMVLGEETLVIATILIKGGSGWWVPGARVRHWIPQKRQTLAYYKQYCFGVGSTSKQSAEYKQGPRMFGRPRWLLRRAMELYLQYPLKIFSGDSDEKFEYLTRLWITNGQLFG